LYSTEDSITPLRDIVHVLEGNGVTLSCNYSGSAGSLLWYRQYPGSEPQFLILILEASKTPQKRLLFNIFCCFL
ncbi:hypothetical protein AGIG_G25607, partial [Arapaima gigas]